MWYRSPDRHPLARRVAGWAGIVMLTGVGCVAFQSTPTGAVATPLVGTFTVTAGSCSGGTASGTYLRMVLSGGSNTAGPYFSNSDSTCNDNSYTPLAAGTAGGLVTGTYQTQPTPAFDGSGNALSGTITAPVPFEGVKFATATNAVDPQTGLHVPAPTITANGTALSGNLEAFGVSWNKQEFNQGSPKPGGGAPGNTQPVTGTYNAATGAYTLQWSSQIVGGPFNGFSAFWNLTGRFIPAAAAPAQSSAPVTGPVTAAGSAASSAQAAAPGSPTTTPSPTATTTTVAPSGSATPNSTSHLVLSSRTTTSGVSGWNSPHWLIVLIIVLGLLGLGGVLWSEQAIRRQRFTGAPVPGGQS
ncbi:MAG TPA: hypothetical protein VHV57_09970 [Acidimicrobiales bacterium]|jgi:hypothetical protein|nr:hypothetical protein [Acidimicrobiales bacterium]